MNLNLKWKPENVRCVWSDELLNQKAYVADSMAVLKRRVEHLEEPRTVLASEDILNYPFAASGDQFRYVYWEPYFDCMIAFAQGKEVQVKEAGKWVDLDVWLDFETKGREFRIKPEGGLVIDIGDVITHQEVKQMVIAADEEFVWLAVSGKVRREEL